MNRDLLKLVDPEYFRDKESPSEPGVPEPTVRRGDSDFMVGRQAQFRRSPHLWLVDLEPQQPDPSQFIYEPHELQELFHHLARTWEQETGHLSSTLHRFMHPAYQRIIGLGPQAVPLIMEELRAWKNHWFWALTAITGKDPSQPGDSVRVAAQAWLTWWEEVGERDTRRENITRTRSKIPKFGAR